MISSIIFTHPIMSQATDDWSIKLLLVSSIDQTILMRLTSEDDKHFFGFVNYDHFHHIS